MTGLHKAPIPPLQFSIAGLMTVVAIAAGILYLVRHLVIVQVVVGTCVALGQLIVLAAGLFALVLFPFVCWAMIDGVFLLAYWIRDLVTRIRTKTDD